MKIKKSLAGLITVLVAAMFTMALAGCGAQDVNVTIDDNGTTTEVSVASGKTVGDALAAADIKVGDKDVVDPALDTKIDGQTNKITIKRCVTVKVDDDGQVKDVELVGGTVADALTQAEIILSDGDSVDVDVNAPLQDGMTIVITRAQVTSPQSGDAGSSGFSYGGDASDDVAADEPPAERSLVSKTPVPNCNDENHGYYEILYSDGSMEYEEY